MGKVRGLRARCQSLGVELDATTVEEYRLRDLYDEVWVMDAGDLINDANRVFDAVIIGDCIEHMRKNVGLDLLIFSFIGRKPSSSNFLCRCRRMPGKDMRARPIFPCGRDMTLTAWTASLSSAILSALQWCEAI